VSGFFESGPAATAATWIAALVTLAVWSYLVGERRLLRIAQLLLAGLATGYLALLAIHDVLGPQLIGPFFGSRAARPDLWIAAVLVVVLIGGAWLPRRLTAVPAAIVVGATAAYALGGAVTGTLLPQVASGIVSGDIGAGTTISGIIGLAITIPVLLSFLHGTPRAPLLTGVARLGRWFLVGGLGAWLGFLLMSRLALLVDRLGFLLGDWLGLAR
jgi:hypothetical protein